MKIFESFLSRTTEYLNKLNPFLYIYSDIKWMNFLDLHARNFGRRCNALFLVNEAGTPQVRELIDAICAGTSAATFTSSKRQVVL